MNTQHILFYITLLTIKLFFNNMLIIAIITNFFSPWTLTHRSLQKAMVCPEITHFAYRTHSLIYDYH